MHGYPAPKARIRGTHQTRPIAQRAAVRPAALRPGRERHGLSAQPTVVRAEGRAGAVARGMDRSDL